jgi:acetyl esterase/lipase
MTQRLIREGPIKLGFTVLITPWTNMVSKKMPSEPDYANLAVFTGNMQYLGQPAWWNAAPIFETNEHLLLLNASTRATFQKYLDVYSVPANNSIVAKDPYYKAYKAKGTNSLYTSVKSLSSNSLLNRDQKLKERVMKLFTDSVSPSLADDATVSKYPPTYMLVCNVDPLRYDNLIFAERLQRLNVNTVVGMFDCDHGAAFGKMWGNSKMWDFIARQVA